MYSNNSNNEESKRVPANRYKLPTLPDNSMKFRLEAQKDDFIYKPEERQFSYYQICQFSLNKKYAVRKLIYNETGDLITYRENNLKKNILDRFLKKCPEYKYTIYPAYTLDVVEFPHDNDILTALSQILNGY